MDVIIFPAASADRQTLALSMKKSGATQVYSEDPYIICKAHDLKILAGITQMDWVAAARQVTRKFSDVTGAIVQAGSRTILPGEKFHVRVIQAAKADFVEECGIASAGALIEKLAEETPGRQETSMTPTG